MSSIPVCQRLFCLLYATLLCSPFVFTGCGGGNSSSDLDPEAAEIAEAQRRAEEAKKRDDALKPALERAAEIAAKRDLETFIEEFIPEDQKIEFRNNVLAIGEEQQDREETFLKGLQMLTEAERVSEGGPDYAVFHLADHGGPDTPVAYSFSWNEGSWWMLGYSPLNEERQRLAERRAALIPVQLSQLEQLSAAILKYVDEKGHYPTDILAEDGTPLLSWRVAILPWLGEADLHAKFDLTEAWDSKKNKALLTQKPLLFGVGVGEDEATILAPAGDVQIVGGKQAIQPEEISDGADKTVMLTLSRGDLPKWTQPQDYSVPDDEPISGLKLRGYQWPLVTADGVTHLLRPELSDEEFLAAIHPADDESVEFENYRFLTNLQVWPLYQELGFTLKNDELSLALLGQAISAYVARTGKFPQNIYSNSGEPLLSWRVALLKDLGEIRLFRRFQLDEPWNSLTNKPLLDECPPVFRSGPDANTTSLLAATGDGTSLAGKKSIRLYHVRDGLDNTVGIVAAKSSKLVEWTKPDDIALDELASAVDLSSAPLAVLLSGKVVRLNAEASEEQLRGLFTIDGGEDVTSSFEIIHNKHYFVPGITPPIPGFRQPVIAPRPNLQEAK